MNAALQFAFGVHLHQPRGNFDYVFEDHLEHVYAPFLSTAVAQAFGPFTLHLSGPLLEWLEQHGTGYLDRVGRLVDDGRLELLASGLDEPVLAALGRAERVEQIEAMRDRVARRFGVAVQGLWLTERVWEPDLPQDLARAGIEYVLVDDRHLLTAGVPRARLDRPYHTAASEGSAVALLPIDERLRYLIPFRPVEEFARQVRELREAGARAAVLADDGEKFGGWPHTRKRVYEDGWLDAFFDQVRELEREGAIRLVTCGDAAARPSGGFVALSTGSYREMEIWSLPAERARALDDLDASRLAVDPAFVRGGHWRGFFAKYPESRRMQVQRVALSRLCGQRGDPPAVRRAIGRASCNDAYWHGVFGGIYLPFLRAAVWSELIAAERELRTGEPLEVERHDIDADGHEEILLHSARFSAIVAPHRGGSVEVLCAFARGENLADTLTRRLEDYHAWPGEPAWIPEDDGTSDEGDADAIWRDPERAIATIHDPSGGRPRPPGVDIEARALFIERVLYGGLARDRFVEGDYSTLASWATLSHEPRPTAVADDDCVTIEMVSAADAPALSKRYTWRADGSVRLDLEWKDDAWPPGAVMTCEVSLAFPAALATDSPLEPWDYSIVTLARSERGFEEITQGAARVLRWPATLGRASVTLDPNRKGAQTAC